MDGFLKTNGTAPSVPKLSGFQKTAIFLGEIGPEASNAILARLNLSTAEITAIRREMQNLGYYNPQNQYQVMKEYSVLSEAANFGIARGIYRDVPHLNPQELERKEKVDNFSKQNPQDIANFLRMMLESK